MSRLHGKVSRHLFEPLFPHWPADEVPVGHVTNGVHMPSWESAAANDLWTKACGKECWLRTTETLEHDIRRASDTSLWQLRTDARTSLIDEQGIPTAWVARMRESMSRLTPRFSATRTVREYTEQHYLPAATAYHLRMANKGAIGRQMVDWRHSLEQKWATLHFGEVKVETRGERHVFEVQVFLNDLDPESVRVELYAASVMGSARVRQEMKRVRQPTGAPGGYVYSAAVSAARPPADYTARVIPHCDGAAVPLEDAHILWQG